MTGLVFLGTSVSSHYRYNNVYAFCFQIDTDKLFNNIGDITNANCEFWKCHLVKVLEESRSSASLLNPSVMKEGFKKVRSCFCSFLFEKNTLSGHVWLKIKVVLTLKAPLITTAADDFHKYFFIVFQRN